VLRFNYIDRNLSQRIYLEGTDWSEADSTELDVILLDGVHSMTVDVTQYEYFCNSDFLCFSCWNSLHDQLLQGNL